MADPTYEGLKRQLSVANERAHASEQRLYPAAEEMSSTKGHLRAVLELLKARGELGSMEHISLDTTSHADHDSSPSRSHPSFH